MIDVGREVAMGIPEASPRPENPFKEKYDRFMLALNRLGITTILPESEDLGVIGIDGKEYPRPEWQQVADALKKNKQLVERKRQQGFTKLQITPLAVPIQTIVQRAKETITRHAKEGKIFQAKQHSSDPDTLVEVNLKEPLYIWDEILKGDVNNLVYFPKSFTESHQGVTKEQIIQDPAICGVPGWSIGLVEDTPFLPREGQGKIVGGRKQLENRQSPNEYLQALAGGAYSGETGWTPEEFLIDFLTTLETTNQVSHDWDNLSALWLIGSYLPNEGCVPYGYWVQYDRRLRLFGDYPSIQIGRIGLRSTVRLGT